MKRKQDLLRREKTATIETFLAQERLWVSGHLIKQS